MEDLRVEDRGWRLRGSRMEDGRLRMADLETKKGKGKRRI
jgi:hypothetical protein